MIRPLVTTVDEPDRRTPLVIFAIVQLSLLAAIPLLAWVGTRALLNSRDGQFVEQVLPGQPGWIAEVEPTPTAVVLATHDGRVVGGVAVAALDSTSNGGTVVMLAPSLPVGSTTLGALSPVRAGPELADELGWTFTTIEVLDDVRWERALGDRRIVVDNPDPVLDAEGVLAFAVGPVELGAIDIGPYLAGRLAAVGSAGEDDARPETVASSSAAIGEEVFRHRLFWEELLAVGVTRPGEVGSVFAAALDPDAVSAGGTVFVELPATAEEREALWRGAVGVLSAGPLHPAVEVTLPADGPAIEAALADLAARGLAVVSVEIEDRPVGERIEVVGDLGTTEAALVAERLDLDVVTAPERVSGEGDPTGVRPDGPPLVRLAVAEPTPG